MLISIPISVSWRYSTVDRRGKDGGMLGRKFTDGFFKVEQSVNVFEEVTEGDWCLNFRFKGPIPCVPGRMKGVEDGFTKNLIDLITYIPKIWEILGAVRPDGKGD